MKDRIRVQQQANKATGKYIVYWMQQAQRAEFNPALDYAIELANQTALPLVVVFVLTEVAEANLRHYSFMINGLWETTARLQSFGISMLCLVGYPPDVIENNFPDALEIVTDMGYLKYQRAWRLDLRQKLSKSGIGYTEVETEPLIPVGTVSDKEEYSAATIRRKLCRKLNSLEFPGIRDEYKITKKAVVKTISPCAKPHEMTLEQFRAWVYDNISLDNSVTPVASYRGGRLEALESLSRFLAERLALYATKRNEPSLDIQSGLSPYLHFGQISACEVVRELLNQGGIQPSLLGELIWNKAAYELELPGFAAFAEELIIRRELSFNLCHYNESYDSFACLPGWAKQTLLTHIEDKRAGDYSLDRLLQCATDDIYWNSANKEMMISGKMHNYMRMYWGKRLLAWMKSPEEAYQVLLYLNNKFELDGRDPNAYAGVAWCFGKHDRPWQRRPIYGSVRYMNAAGLERKFDMKAYVKKVGN